MLSYKRFLTIAGSDSGGGAGIQADIKTATALGCFASSVITAITVQNTVGVRGVMPVPADIIEAQGRAVLEDIGADAVKIGMLGSAAAADVVRRLLADFKCKNIVLDPVLVATSGDSLAAEGVRAAILKLLPVVDLLTPNIPETKALTGIDINSEDDVHKAWKILKNQGLRALLVKGGHAASWQGQGELCDYLFTDSGVEKFISERIETNNSHGTGCTLSSAIAAQLALGANSMQDAVREATFFTHKAILRGREYKLGEGHGPLNWA